MRDFILTEERGKAQVETGLLSILKISILIVVLVLGGCKNLPKELEWYSSKDIGKNWQGLKKGDIIIKNKKLEPMSWFGHSAIVVADGVIGDYPKIGVNYYEIDPYSWLFERRKVVVLRYKHYDERFEQRLLENIVEYSDRKYKVHFDKESDKSFYCSQFIWYLYWKTAKDLGYHLDLDGNGGSLVKPYDFLISPELEQVPFYY